MLLNDFGPPGMSLGLRLCLANLIGFLLRAVGRLLMQCGAFLASLVTFLGRLGSLGEPWRDPGRRRAAQGAWAGGDACG